MSIDDLWYKNAVIYCLDVEKFQDANGDGIGDFEGLMRRLEQKVRLRVGAPRDDILVEVFDGRHSRRQNDGQHRLTLDAYGWRWYRVGAPDNVLDRCDLSGPRQDAPTARDPGKP